MIWVTWRQQRLEAVVGGILLAAIAALLLKAGIELAAAYRLLDIARCSAQQVQNQMCAQNITEFRQQFFSPETTNPWSVFVILPVIFAVLLAAPLVLELEHGTYRLAWTQSITRLRWLSTRLGLLLVTAIAASLAISLLTAWWHGPWDTLNGAFAAASFDYEGITPVAYTVFALALALAMGTLLRRAIPAMMITLAGFLALRFGIEFWARPYYLPPVSKRWTDGPIPVGPHDWVVDRGRVWQDLHGHLFSYDQVLALCGPANPNLSQAATKNFYIACYNHFGLGEIVRYQPADRFWLFQGIESAIFLGLATGLLALTFWWVRYRLS
jgi:hypothetical protein